MRLANNNSKGTCTISEVDVCILEIRSEFQLKMSTYDRNNEQKLKNYLTGPKFELNLFILVTHLDFNLHVAKFCGRLRMIPRV